MIKDTLKEIEALDARINELRSSEPAPAADPRTSCSAAIRSAPRRTANLPGRASWLNWKPSAASCWTGAPT